MAQSMPQSSAPSMAEAMASSAPQSNVPQLKVRALAAAALLLSTAVAAAPQAHAAFDHEGLAVQALEGHIRPSYAAFKARTGELKSALDAACKAHDIMADASVKAAFRNSVLAWARVEHLKFGPILENNRNERIVFFPDRQKIGERQVQQILNKQDPGALSVAGLQQKSVAVQGLTALEVLLYAKPAETYLAATPEATFACGYASAVAQNMAAIATDVAAAWAKDGGYTALWLKPGDDDPLFKTSSGPTAELLTAFRNGISNARDAKLLPSLGLKKTGLNGTLAPKSKPPFDVSGLGLAAIIANIEGVLDLVDKGGLAERLAVTKKDTAAMIKNALQRAIRIGRELEPQGAAVFKDKAAAGKLASMRDPLAAAAAGNEQMANAAGMVMGFTADDGD